MRYPMKKYGLKKKSKSKKKDDNENVDHAFLGVLSAYLDDFLAILNRRLRLVKIDIFLDKKRRLGKRRS